MELPNLNGAKIMKNKAKSFLYFVAFLLCTLTACETGTENQAEQNEQEAESEPTPSNRINQLMLAAGLHGGKGFDRVHLDNGEYVDRISLRFVDDRSFTSEKLKVFEGQENIVGLDLRGTAVTDEGLAVLATLPDLEFVHFAKTNITEAGLKSLQQCPKLYRLDLRETKISEKAVDVLVKIKSLKQVYTFGTPVDGVEGLEVVTTNELDYFGRQLWREYLNDLSRWGIKLYE
jgi:hypothetical protein